MASYVPDRDGDFDTWVLNFKTYVAAHVADLGLLPADGTGLTTQQAAWAAAYAAHVTAHEAAAAARETKDAARRETESYIRPLVRRLQVSSQVDDAERRAMGISVRDTTPTRVGPPTTRPVLQADTHDPGRLTLSFADEGTPTSKAKPAGVSACLLQYKKGGTAPVADADWQFLAVDSATPYVAIFDMADAGAAVWVRACWINTHQEQGPWSSVLATRVPG